MTWEEFKKAVEDAGVQPNDVLADIDVRGTFLKVENININVNSDFGERRFIVEEK